MYWDEAKECMSRDELTALQSRRLRQLCGRALSGVPFYQKKFKELGISLEDVRGVEDLSQLPFTTKGDLRDNYPYGLFATPLDEIVRIHASSGTTGKPTVVGYTERDLGVWSEVMARTLTSGGVTKNSVVQVSFGYGLFTGGLGAHAGAERIGASVIPTSAGNTQRQIMIMRDFGTTAICCTPSYALYLAETIEEMGIDKSELKLRYGIFGAEPWTESMHREIETRLGIRATDIYGLSEIIGPGVSYSCEAKDGMHLSEDHFLAEIIDPGTLKPLPYGEKGELVITTITKEGIPLIRYRTRDITALNPEKCVCGRTHARMAKVMGRSDDMLIIRGVNVFPSQIEEALLRLGEVDPQYMIYVKREGNLDSLEVRVEIPEHLFSDEIRVIEGLKKRIGHEIYTVTGIGVDVRLVEPKSIQRSEGKATRVIDERNLK